MIAFLASGVSYAKYRWIFKSFLSMNAFSPQTFIEMIGAIHPNVCAMLDNMCNEAKAEMKQKHAPVRLVVGSKQSPLQMAAGQLEVITVKMLRLMSEVIITFRHRTNVRTYSINVWTFLTITIFKKKHLLINLWSYSATSH